MVDGLEADVPLGDVLGGLPLWDSGVVVSRLAKVFKLFVLLLERK